MSFRLPVHALPVASHSGRKKQDGLILGDSDSVWFFFKWSCLKNPCAGVWNFEVSQMILSPSSLSLSQILKECPFSVNMSTHIPTFLLLFIVWTLSTSTATNTTARPKNPSAPLQLNAAMASCRWLSTMRRLRRCCAVRNGGRFRPPCCHSLTPPLLVKRWDKGRNLKWFYLDPLILMHCDMWLDWKGMIFKWFVQ